MKFLSVNNFVNTTMKIVDKATTINVVFSVKEAVEMNTLTTHFAPSPKGQNISLK